jgi:rubrerythrin
MKRLKSKSNFNQNFVKVLMVSSLAISSLFMLPGCSTTKDTTIETAPTVQETTSQAPESTQPIDHNIDINPTALSDADKALSLEGYGAKGALADKNLSINDMLMYAAQDEYLAHGEYVAITNKFGSQKPYSNIISAEETHLAYLKEVYISYGLDFPADASIDYIVVPADLLEAANTGVQAEIDNIAMYKNFLTYDLPDNVLEVFSALKTGSDSHLASFQKQVEKLK